MTDKKEAEPVHENIRRRKEEPLMRWFEYAHLAEAQQKVSAPWCELAWHVVVTIPRSAERTVALRKLLEGKDAAVRASLPE